ncbi:MAG: Aeromonas phage vB AsaM-56, partial [Pseudomonadota bacterium]
MNLSDDDRLEIEREYSKRKLSNFIREAWAVVEPANPYVHGWHIDAICEHLEAVTSGEINRLLINVPPGPMRYDSIVETGRGAVKLCDVVSGDNVLTHMGRYKNVSAVHEQGVLPILKIVTNSGRETFAAPTHPYLTPRGWVNASELRPGDILAVVNREEDRKQPSLISEDECRFLGYMVGDGSSTHGPSFTNADQDVIDDFIRCAQSLGMICTKRSQKTFWIIGLRGSRELLSRHGLLGANSYTKRIPQSVMNSSIENLGAFLGAYWSCDGGVDVRPTRQRGSAYRAYATTVSEGLAHDLVFSLGLVGIESRIRRKSRKLETKVQPGGVYKSFSIEVQSEDMAGLVLKLPAMCARKSRLASECREKFKRPLWDDEIVSIESDTPARCLCLTVDEDHSFTCSGIAVKNTMKSLITNVFWPSWEWGPRRLQSMRYVGASHSQEFATRDTMKMRRLVSSEWYQNLWPTPLTKDQNEKQKFENLATGFRQAMAMKSLTGTRGDRVLIDDPHSVEGALSDAERETTIRVFKETVPTRLNNPERSAIIVIMQRLHEGDVSGVILEEEHGYVHLMLPMEFETERKCRTRIGFEDPRAEEGELLFPERFPRDVVDRDSKLMGSHAVAGQFQQRPGARGGTVFLIDGIQYYDKRDMPQKFDKVVASWDCTFKDTD